MSKRRERVARGRGVLQCDIRAQQPSEQVTDPIPASAAHRKFVVGIGASAGGLEAITGLVSNLPTRLGMTLVIAQHLSPTYRSMMVQLLARATPMQVREAVHGLRPESDVIYVAPANCNLIVKQGAFQLLEPDQPIQPKPSVNLLFESLAEEFGPDAIGLVLSGTGKDGARGIKAISAAGGTTFAQAPETAKYDGMPKSAIETSCVHRVLPPERIAEELMRLASSQGTHLVRTIAEPPALEVVLDRLRRRTGVDFSCYKNATINRRIERRVLATESATIEDYLNHIESRPEELDTLYQDVLISVTAFFRDAEAFSALRAEVRRLVNDTEPGQQMRVWVPGCATGEEAYSIGMLFADELGNRLQTANLQIFATDLDPVALALARRGHYPSHAVAGIDPDYLQRFFTSGEDHWSVTKAVRDLVVFARHDLAKDPPFIRINLISCRNVLIYFNSVLQRRVLEMFQFALGSGGALFLGRSEGIHHADDLYSVIDKAARLYRSKPGVHRNAVMVRPRPADRASARTSVPMLPDFAALAASFYIPPGLIVNSRQEIIVVHGDVTRFVTIPHGRLETDITHLIKSRYRADLLGLMHRAKRSQKSQRGQSFTLEATETAAPQQLQIVVHPVKTEGADLLLVSFETSVIAPVKVPASELSTDAPRYQDLEQELVLTKEHLHTVIEELETSNEELQSLNEEMQATNEELQTANEQLQTVNEELQATNEELVTVNDELEAKSAEVADANLELESIARDVGWMLIAFDKDQRIVRANHSALKVFGLAPDSPGTASDLNIELAGDGLADLLGRVLSQGVKEEAIAMRHGRHYALCATPWRNAAKAIIGILLTLYDNTDLVHAETASREYQSRLNLVMANSPAMITVKDLAGRYEFANAEFLNLVGCDIAEIIGKRDVNFFSRTASDNLRERDLQVLHTNGQVQSEDVVEVGGEARTYLSVRFPLTAADGAIRAICTQGLDITARKRMEEELRHQGQLIRTVLDSILSNLAAIDQHGTIVAVNKAWSQFAEKHGAESGKMLGVGGNYLDVVRKATNQGGCSKSILEGIESVLQGRESESVMHYYCDLDGRRYWYNMTVTAFASGEGAIITHTDITERRAVEEYLRLVAAVFENSSEGVMILDRGRRVVTANPACAYLTGTSESELIGGRWRQLHFARLTGLTLREFMHTLKQEHRWQGEVWLQRQDNTKEFPVWLNVSVMRNAIGRLTHYIVLFSDISRIKDAERSLYELAYHDALTGLPNRALLLDRISHALTSAARRHKPLALMFLDLDRFKIINDSLGHDTGDALLRAAAQRIKDSVRKTDMVARLGGDEFVVLVEDLRHEEDAAITACKIIGALGSPFEINGQEVYVSTSIGITIYPDDGDSVRELLKNADSSMYRAKELGRNRYQFFTAQMHQRSQRRLWIESQLRHAIAREELYIQYQPQSEIESGRVRGFEALLRWNHSEHGAVLPSEFIPVAEETGMILKIGEWVLRNACSAFQRLRKFVPSLEIISVNVSAHQLREATFVSVVEDVLREAGLTPSSLELELTESALVEHTETTVGVLRTLRELGVRISLDDFGTGYSSLSYLRRFPITSVKIDQSFIRDIPVDPNDVAIVQAILALAEVLGLEVIAEGVEQPRQLQLLREWGCSFCQGFLTGRPVEEEQMER